MSQKIPSFGGMDKAMQNSKPMITPANDIENQKVKDSPKTKTVTKTEIPNQYQSDINYNLVWGMVILCMVLLFFLMSYMYHKKE